MRHRNRFRTTSDIVIPKGNPVIFVSHVKQEAYRLANALVRVDAGQALRVDDEFR